MLGPKPLAATMSAILLAMQTIRQIDTTDAESLLIAPCMPKFKRIGRKRTTDLRRVVDAIFYLASCRCQWRMLRKDFPPPSTVLGVISTNGRDDGTWKAINHGLSDFLSQWARCSLDCFTYLTVAHSSDCKFSMA